jgi:hypothetical protein
VGEGKLLRWRSLVRRNWQEKKLTLSAFAIFILSY